MPTRPLPWVEEWVTLFVLEESSASQVEAWVERTAYTILEEVPELSLIHI